MKAKRYDLGTVYQGSIGAPGIIEYPGGQYVLASDYDKLVEQVEAVGAGGVSPLMGAQPDAVQPTGEQLYMMVCGRFKSGSFPWGMVSESGKAAWCAAAADLMLSPDTILARNFQPASAEEQPWL